LEKQLVEGSEKEQYNLIWDYANELIKSNDGSTVKVNTILMPDSPSQFKRFYVCLVHGKKHSRQVAKLSLYLLYPMQLWMLKTKTIKNGF
jgi:hypothetical protein